MKKRDTKTSNKIQKVGNKRAKYEKERLKKKKLQNNIIQA